MAGFDSNDLYTVSAGTLVTDYWNPFVIKHDNQSFYNWEQDNLPLHDLEERTNYLWEKFGWPTSSLPGMVFAVSSSIPTHLDVSCNFFLDVSSALKALPEVIRMPVLIEVCTSGNLGDLNLDNLRFEGDGALEIINRVSIRINGCDNEDPDILSSIVTFLDTNIEQAPYILSSGDGLLSYSDTSCLLGSSNDIPFGDNTTTDGVARGFVQVRERMKEGSNRPALMVDSISQKLLHSDSGDYNFRFTPIGINKFGTALADPTGNLDLSVLGKDNNSGSIDIEYDTPRGGEPIFIKTQIDAVSQETPAHGITTNNYLRRLRLSNCGGPIYIRGFIVDPAEDEGATAPYTYTHSYEEGILVENCNNLTLENCGVMRGRGCGLRVNNSTVYLRRGFASSRNYEVLAADERSKGSIGIQSNNSTLIVKTDSYVSGGEYFFNVQHNDVGLELNNSILKGGDSYKDSIVGTRMNPTVLNFCFNKTGISATQSKISVDGLISVYTNFIGIDLHDSTFHIDGLNIDGNQDIGLKLHSSNVIYSKNEWRFPADTDLPKYGDGTTSQGDHFIPKPYQIAFAVNGQHIHSYNSSFRPKELSTKEINYVDTLPMIVFKDHFGHDAAETFFDEVPQLPTLKPSVYLDSSDFELCHTLMFSPQAILDQNINRNGFEVYTVINKGSFGHLLKAVNNSNVVFKGSSKGPTFLVGSPKASATKKLSNLYISDNSSCKLLGKTFMAQGGTSVIADNYSKVHFGPLEDSNGYLGVSSWDLKDVENHATVEIHSGEACLVANNKSTISMRDIGSYDFIWSGSDVNPSAYDYYTTSSHARSEAGGGIGLNYAPLTDLSSYLYAGSFIMLPNTMDSRESTAIGGGVNGLNGPSNIYRNHLTARSSETAFHRFNNSTAIGAGFHASVLRSSYASPTMDEDIFIRGSESGTLSEGLSHGGYCVRALNGSHVECVNVHFVPGPNLTDKPYMDSPALVENEAGCYNLRIWNFGKDSSFHSAFLSVSGAYPSIAPYWGPQSYHIKPGTEWLYGSGNHNTSAIAYTAFSSFEWSYDDNGTVYMQSDNLRNLAVLDTFGDTCQVDNGILGGSPIKAKTLAQNRYKANYLSSTGLSAADPKGVTDMIAGDNFYGMFGENGPYNRGPFRLYFAVDSKANLLHYSDSPIDDKRPYQLLSQGYHLSGNCTTIEDDAPYGPSPFGVLNNLDLLHASGAEGQSATLELAMSGYYHVSAFVDATFKDRIIIDESGSNTFANAKHCSYTFDGRPPLLTIYRSTISPEGEGSLATTDYLGQGIRSVNIYDLGRDI